MAQDQKGARATSAWLVFFDESAISLSPVVRRTWAPRGQTPTLRHRGHWKRASMAAALGYRSDASGARLCFHVQKDSYNTVSLIGVLEQLKAFYQGQQVVLLGDGLGAHWSNKLCDWLEGQQDWLTVERLPAYAPELNPVEGLWANLQDGGAGQLRRRHRPGGRRPGPAGHRAGLRQRGVGGRVSCPHRPHARRAAVTLMRKTQ